MATVNSIQAAKLEDSGEAAFRIVGRTLVLRTVAGVEHKWHCRTEREAADHLRLFRSSLKFVS